MLCLIRQAPTLSHWRLRKRLSSSPLASANILYRPCFSFSLCFANYRQSLYPHGVHALYSVSKAGFGWFIYKPFTQSWSLICDSSITRQIPRAPFSLLTSFELKLTITLQAPSFADKVLHCTYQPHFLALNGVFFFVSPVFTRTGSCRMGVWRPYDEYPRARRSSSQSRPQARSPL